MSEAIKQQADRWTRWYGVTREQLEKMWKKDKEKIGAHFAWAEKAGLK